MIGIFLAYVIVDIDYYLQQISSHSFVLRFPSRQVGSAHFLPLLFGAMDIKHYHLEDDAWYKTTSATV